MSRRRIYLEVCPGVAERAVIIGRSWLPGMIRVLSRGAIGGKCWRGLAHQRDCIERPA